MFSFIQHPTRVDPSFLTVLVGPNSSFDAFDWLVLPTGCHTAWHVSPFISVASCVSIFVCRRGLSSVLIWAIDHLGSTVFVFSPWKVAWRLTKVRIWGVDMCLWQDHFGFAMCFLSETVVWFRVGWMCTVFSCVGHLFYLVGPYALLATILVLWLVHVDSLLFLSNQHVDFHVLQVVDFLWPHTLANWFSWFACRDVSWCFHFFVDGFRVLFW
jgi:hypothetical protein